MRLRLLALARRPGSVVPQARSAPLSPFTWLIRLAAYSLTSKPIARAPIAARARGVDIDVVLDKSNPTANRTQAGDVAAAGVPVRIGSRYAIMHDKFIVVDGVTVEAGSFNLTAAAERSNAENLPMLQGDDAVARLYEENWESLWNESRAWDRQ